MNRSSQQNRAIHLYLTLKAQQLREAGHSVQDVVKVIRLAELTPTMENLKEIAWRPIQIGLFNVESSTQLLTNQPDLIHENMEKTINEQLHTEYIPFPNLEELIWKNYLKT